MKNLTHALQASEETPLLLAGRYHLHRTPGNLLGEGAMGQVYQGQDTYTDHPVAVKVAHPDLIRYHPDLLPRFMREGEALRQLNHPNIVQLLAAAEQEGQHYLIMEYVAGGSLADLLRRDGSLSLPRAFAIGLELADALSRAHHLNILHRDIKPGNVLLAEDGTPRLTDFGLARLNDGERFTETGIVMGTVDYLSPEACQGETLDARSDIWAFGVLLYELVTGQRPFTGSTLMATMTAILTQPLPDPRQYRPELPSGVIELLERILRKNRAERPGSMRQIAAALESLAQGRLVSLLAAQPEPSHLELTYLDVSARPNNLPPQRTVLVGRAQELAQIADLLAQPGKRLITIAATGGMGKTCLALAVAEEQLKAETYRDGVFLISLAPLSDLSAVLPALAEAVTFPIQANDPRTPRRQVLDYLRHKQMLLVFDNFEHLLDEARLVDDILQAAPDVKVLVTSREPLRLYAEQVFPLVGLAFNEAEVTTEDAAAQLFLRRARRARPDLPVGQNELTHLTIICRQVAGMPLGLELAAAWVDTLPLADIATELQRSLDLLETDLRDVPERQRSMRVVFDASWQRLNEAEQQLFARLSVFRGGFTRDAAAAICAPEMNLPAFRRLLAGLTRKCFLQYDPEADRYDVHELMRQYGAEQLDSAVESQVRSQQLNYFADLAKGWHDLYGPDEVKKLDYFEAEYANIQEALTWALQDRKQIENGLRLVSFTDAFWVKRGHLLEGREWLVKLRQMAPNTIAPAIKAHALLTEAEFEMWFFRFDRARPLIEESLTHYRQLDNRAGVARSLLTLGKLEMLKQNWESATGHFEESLALDDDKVGTASTLLELGRVAGFQSDWRRAKSYCEQALKLFTVNGDLSGSAFALRMLGGLAVEEQNPVAAKQYLEEALTLFQRIKDIRAVGTVYVELGDLARLQGNYHSAANYYSQSIDIHRQLRLHNHLFPALFSLGMVKLKLQDVQSAEKALLETLSLSIEFYNVSKVASALEGLGCVATVRGQMDRAARLLGAAVATHENTNTRLGFLDQLEHDHHVAAARTQLGEAAFSDAWAAGQAMSLEEAIAYAREA